MDYMTYLIVFTRTQSYCDAEKCLIKNVYELRHQPYS